MKVEAECIARRAESWWMNVKVSFIIVLWSSESDNF